jgi:hypothetical protein
MKYLPACVDASSTTSYHHIVLRFWIWPITRWWADWNTLRTRLGRGRLRNSIFNWSKWDRCWIYWSAIDSCSTCYCGTAERFSCGWKTARWSRQGKLVISCCHCALIPSALISCALIFDPGDNSFHVIVICLIQTGQRCIEGWCLLSLGQRCTRPMCWGNVCRMAGACILITLGRHCLD